jgi:hypothetical protein
MKDLERERERGLEKQDLEKERGLDMKDLERERVLGMKDLERDGTDRMPPRPKRPSSNRFSSSFAISSRWTCEPICQ